MLVDVGFKKEGRKKRHRSLRKRIEGTAERPRRAVFRSSRHIYAQVIDDRQQRTLTAVSDKVLAGKGEGQGQGQGKEGGKQPDKKTRAKSVGTAIAKQCLERGIDKVVFDRAGYKYH